MKWNTSNIPNQTGKIAIVTGANSGLGLETARALAAKGATVIMACRNPAKAEKAVQDIRSSVPQAKLEVLLLDLADLALVRSFAETVLTRFPQIHLLINNAGVMGPPLTKTKDGFEVQFGANHLGHFALTGLLLERLLHTPASRVVVVASMVELQAKMEFDNLNGERKYDPHTSYWQSKLANLMFCYELGRRLKAIGVNMVCAGVHPGWTASNLQAHSPTLLFLNRFFSQPASMGALPTLFAATAPEAQTGEYYAPDGFMAMKGYPKKVKSSKLSHDLEVAKQLWAVSEKMTGVDFAVLSKR